MAKEYAKVDGKLQETEIKEVVKLYDINALKVRWQELQDELYQIAALISEAERLQVETVDSEVEAVLRPA